MKREKKNGWLATSCERSREEKGRAEEEGTLLSPYTERGFFFLN